MFHRLLLILVGLVLLAGCAKPPKAELQDTRSVVAQAYTSGAALLAAGEYQLAETALQRAEEQVRDGKYRAAKLTIGLAQRYATEALQLTLQRKKELQEEQQRQQRLAEEQARKDREEQARKDREEQARKDREEQARKDREEQARKAVKESPALLMDVEVEPGATLFTIAARPDVYHDGLLWPLIYKANRDQIKDPLKIFPGQMLKIPRDKTAEELAAARQEALELNLF